MADDVTASELRVLGCLIEKQRTTPDTYPLSLNALRLACNQSTNRDPVVDFDEATVRDAAQRLSRRGWARLASRGGRTVKYRHLADQALGLGEDEISVMAVLMLRGPQTPGELKQRADRMYGFADLDEVHLTLERLIERDYVADRGRQPGQKETRYEQTLGGAGAEVEALPIADSGQDTEHPPEDDRIARLEAEVATLRNELAELRALLDGGERVQISAGISPAGERENDRSRESGRPDHRSQRRRRRNGAGPDPDRGQSRAIDRHLSPGDRGRTRTPCRSSESSNSYRAPLSAEAIRRFTRDQRLRYRLGPDRRLIRSNVDLAALQPSLTLDVLRVVERRMDVEARASGRGIPDECASLALGTASAATIANAMLTAATSLRAVLGPDLPPGMSRAYILQRNAHTGTGQRWPPCRAAPPPRCLEVKGARPRVGLNASSSSPQTTPRNSADVMPSDRPNLQISDGRRLTARREWCQREAEKLGTGTSW